MTHNRILQLLESNWREIRKECVAATNFMEWPEHGIYDGQWDVYGIYDLQGELIEKNAQACPHTTSVLEQIPSLRTGGFSKLTSGSHIKPHKGYTGAVLRCHLGLVVPEGDCHLKVEDEVYTWREGKAFFFDDTLLHEAWNYTDSDRYVLLIDIYRDGNQPTGNDPRVPVYRVD